MTLQPHAAVVKPQYWKDCQKSPAETATTPSSHVNHKKLNLIQFQAMKRVLYAF
jgi:hypothetical protein